MLSVCVLGSSSGCTKPHTRDRKKILELLFTIIQNKKELNIHCSVIYAMTVTHTYNF